CAAFEWAACSYSLSCKRPRSPRLCGGFKAQARTPVLRFDPRGGAARLSPCIKEQRMIRPFVAAVAALATLAGSLGADDFSLAAKNTIISFVGTKPGGKHDGGFKQLTGAATIQDKDATTLKLTVEIDITSLYADNAKLTNHLKSTDFLGVKTNPKS